MQEITTEQMDALRELMNIGVGRAASLLNEMVQSRIILEIPFVKIFEAVDLQQEFTQRFNNDSFAAVRLSFTGSFAGSTDLVFPTESASKLVSLLTGEEPGSPDLNAVKIGTLSEIGNIIINAMMGSISNVLDQHLNYGLPIYLEDNIENILLLSNNINEARVFALAQARFKIELLELIGDIVLILEMSSFDVLIKAINQSLGV
ncbi:chemotaxis protein CheC [Aetokthonos hydrillicola Thurmond2011]|jgi:chemotaxis protein CheC|uniref:Chemotaxis protein CheC n=1 Tax=Aetokthonos hydrillicola Thurmond2011 TaxID=2712845 RepID=A0AAP5M8G6_9CYAN|nr:chemotaxis protein CheC [Aetokthonos hydrillicola]MBO3459342.1 chemotaxis protein CheC [Aetokthonos hydrillicola CCALA 1050]MBW4586488.1 chemotaxis protein CheC [Aetokthonos hydrillicola CCALA 1050]MDR9893568.1 chemotaxis protein CheC [Aetokthonos hydrillicola Thurmond2011]